MARQQLLPPALLSCKANAKRTLASAWLSVGFIRLTFNLAVIILFAQNFNLSTVVVPFPAFSAPRGLPAISVGWSYAACERRLQPSSSLASLSFWPSLQACGKSRGQARTRCGERVLQASSGEHGRQQSSAQRVAECIVK